MDIVAANFMLSRLQLGERRVMYTSPNGVQVTATQTGKFSPHDFAVELKCKKEINDASMSIL